tara:strand:+ start:596 stop:748 length:153 start_codon:yes stop_codon:yes gene_type:complete
VISDCDDVGMQQSVVVNRYAIDHGAIGRAKVNDEKSMLVCSNFSVVTAYV